MRMRSIWFLAVCMTFLLTGCGVSIKDKAGLKLSEKDALQYYADKYGESAKVSSSEYYSYSVGGVGLPSFTEYDTDCRIYRLDNGVTVVYDKGKDMYFDNKQGEEISSAIAEKVLTAILESTGWDYKIIYPGDNERIGYTQSFAEKSFHAYYDGDIFQYIQNADAEIFNYCFYKIYFRMDSEDGWKSTFDKFLNDMEAINGLNGIECFGVRSYDDENTIENVANRVWSYNKSAKLPLSVNNSFDVDDVQVYFTTYGRALDEADRANIKIEDASPLIDTYNEKLGGYKMRTGGKLYRVQMDIEFGKYDIDWNFLTKNFVYHGNENALAFGEDHDGDMKSARYSTNGDWEYFPLDCGNEFFIYIGAFE